MDIPLDESDRQVIAEYMRTAVPGYAGLLTVNLVDARKLLMSSSESVMLMAVRRMMSGVVRGKDGYQRG